MKEQIIEMLKQGKSVKDTRKELKISEATWGRMGYSHIPRYKNIFETINEESAYWLGFLWADGSLSGGILELELNTEDEEHLLKFVNCFTYIKTPTVTRRFRHNAHTTRTYFGDASITNSLLALGFNKKGQRIIPNIPEDMMLHFIRGYFDGDGSYQCRIHNGVYEYRADIAGPKEFIEYIEKYLPEYTTSEIINYKTWTSKRLYWNGKESSKKLIALLAKDSNIKLERKYATLPQ